MFTDFFGHYMPLTWLTLGLDYVFWGMNPFGYHLTNLLFHAANAVLCFFCLRQLVQKARPDPDAPGIDWAAAGGALFFSVHPLRVESVAWITERRDLTSAFFFFWSLLAYLRMTDCAPGTAGHRKWLALSSMAFAASLFSKATGFTLPVVLLLLDVWPLRRFAPGQRASVLREKIPFFAIMIVSIVLTLIAQDHANAIYSLESYPLARSLSMPGYRVSFYVVKSLLPISLTPWNPYQPGFGPREILGWLLLAGITALLVLRRATIPGATVAWLAFAVMIAPVSGIVQAGFLLAVADRYTYLPCLPFAAIAAAGLLAGARRFPARGIVAGASVVLLTLSILTWRQTLIWKDSLSLWDHALRLNPNSYLPYNNRGTAKYEKGDLVGAIRDYEASMSIRADWEKPWNNRGMARARLGDHLGAVQDFTRSLDIDPDQTNPYGYRALSRLKTGDFAGARGDLDEALRRKPEALYYVKRATLRGMDGNLDGAISDYTEALRLRPDYGEALMNRGMAQAQKGDLAAARQDLERALEAAPAGSPQRLQIERLLRGPNPR